MESPNCQAAFEPIVLAFFDVLGFSRRVRTIGLTAIHREYQDIIRLVQQSAAARVASAYIPCDNEGRLAPIGRRGYRLRYAYFSDTILLSAKYELPMVETFLDSTLTFFCEALSRNVPLRGCITFGDAIMNPDEGTFLGEPIIEGYLGESAQSCLGVSFGPSVKQPEFSWLGDLHHVIPFDHHVKPGKQSLVENLVLDWPRRWRNEYDSRCSACEQLQRMDTDARFSGYYTGAERLAMESKQRQTWWESFDFNSVTYGGHVLGPVKGG